MLIKVEIKFEFVLKGKLNVKWKIVIIIIFVVEMFTEVIVDTITEESEMCMVMKKSSLTDI